MKKIVIQKQAGATLITSMLLLVIMTVVGVSATKVSSISVLIAGNDQQKMMLSQVSQSKLDKFATTESLEATLTASGFKPSTGQTDTYIFDQSTSGGIIVDKKIQDKNFNYACKRNGVASNVGSDAPKCDLYDYSIKLKNGYSSARDERHQGSGKMVPNSTDDADLTNGEYNLVN